MDRYQITGVKPKTGQTGLWYLGQEGFVIGSAGQYLAVDPYLSDYVDQNCCQYVQWVRKYPAPITPDKLDMLCAVLCTHSHYDHADPWTLPQIANADPSILFVVPAPETDKIASYGIAKERILPAVVGETISLGTFTVTPIPAAHEELHTDENGHYRELSYLIDDGCNRIFHGGDMCLYDGLPEKIGQVDVAILPINGRDAQRNANDIIGNTDSREAIYLAQRIGAKLLIPVHHDLYEVNKADPEAFITAIATEAPTQRYRFFTPGEGYLFQK